MDRDAGSTGTWLALAIITAYAAITGLSAWAIHLAPKSSRGLFALGVSVAFGAVIGASRTPRFHRVSADVRFVDMCAATGWVLWLLCFNDLGYAGDITRSYPFYAAVIVLLMGLVPRSYSSEVRVETTRATKRLWSLVFACPMATLLGGSDGLPQSTIVFVVFTGICGIASFLRRRTDA